MSSSEGTAKSKTPRVAVSTLDSPVSLRLTPLALARTGDALARLEGMLMERAHTHEAAAATLRRLIARADFRRSRLAPAGRGEPAHGRFQTSGAAKRPPVLPQVSG